MKSAVAILALSALAACAGEWHATDSLSAAIASARDGDTVFVHGPTVFREHIVIEKRLRLIGVENPVLDGGGTNTPLLIRADHVEVRGLIVRNGGADLGGFDSVIMVRGANATIADCRIEGGGFGVFIRGVNDCRIERNTIVGNTNVVAAKRGNGVHLWKTRRNVITANVITHARDGVYLSYADENDITSNRVERTRFGLHYMYSHKNRLADNTFTANAVGAALMFARECVVEGNVAFANRRHGILLKQVENSRIVRNEVRHQNRGLFVQQAVNDRFEDNRIVENDIGLYMSNGSEGNVFAGNSFVANSDQVWQPPYEVERGRLASNRFHDGRRGNYWSDYTGNDANGDGIGDTPYHETDVFGYIVDRHPEARVLASSPAAALLRKGEELMPLLDTKGVTDEFPLIRPRTAEVAAHLRSAESSRSQTQSRFTEARLQP